MHKSNWCFFNQMLTIYNKKLKSWYRIDAINGQSKESFPTALNIVDWIQICRKKRQARRNWCWNLIFAVLPDILSDYNTKNADKIVINAIKQPKKCGSTARMHANRIEKHPNCKFYTYRFAFKNQTEQMAKCKFPWKVKFNHCYNNMYVLLLMKSIY